MACIITLDVLLRCVTAVLFTRSRTWYTIIVKCCSNVANIVQNVWEKLESITRAHCLCLVHFILICGNLSQWNDGDNEQRMLAHLAKEKKYQKITMYFPKSLTKLLYRLATSQMITWVLLLSGKWWLFAWLPRFETGKIWLYAHKQFNNYAPFRHEEGYLTSTRCDKRKRSSSFCSSSSPPVKRFFMCSNESLHTRNQWHTTAPEHTYNGELLPWNFLIQWTDGSVFLRPHASCQCRNNCRIYRFFRPTSVSCTERSGRERVTGEKNR